MGTPAQVYTLPAAGSPTYARVGRYTTVHARALYTWAHPLACTVFARPVNNLCARRLLYYRGDQLSIRKMGRVFGDRGHVCNGGDREGGTVRREGREGGREGRWLSGWRRGEVLRQAEPFHMLEHMKGFCLAQKCGSTLERCSGTYVSYLAKWRRKRKMKWQGQEFPFCT